MNEIIKNYYYDVNTGYVSANKLYQKMKAETTHETIHVALKKTKKIDKELKQVGIDQKYDLGDSKRIKKPSYKLLNQ